ncbi:MAG: hypothetical protein H7842_12730, partial [Gammaproteobacteria bacterium SHHR-1]
IRPHPKQFEQLAEHGLKWKEGDHAANLESMLMASRNYLLSKNPELAHYGYDFDRQIFVDSRTGQGVDRSRFKSLAEATRSEKTKVGHSSLQRAFLTNSLVQEGGRSDRDKILGSALVMLAGRRLGQPAAEHNRPDWPQAHRFHLLRESR